MHSTKITVITVTYNCKETISDTIESVLNQDYSNYEYIIIDGKSNDGTIDVIEGYRKKHDINLISEPDQGIYDAINKGIKRSTGDIICILHAGDNYFPDTFSKINQYYNAASDKENFALASSVRIVKNNGEVIDRIRSQRDPFSVSTKKVIHQGILHSGIFLSKKLYDRFGLYNIDYNVSADFELISNLCFAGIEFIYADEILISIEEFGYSADPKNYIQKVKDHYRTKKKYLGRVAAIKYAYIKLKPFVIGKVKKLIKRQ